MRLLIINPGSTSTKVSVFEDKNELFEESRFHDAPELLKYPEINDQIPFRYGVILEILKEHDIAPETIDCYVGRGDGVRRHDATGWLWQVYREQGRRRRLWP